VVFRLDTTGLRGNVTLTADNWLIYTPCRDCSGQDTLKIYVVEKRTDGEEPLIVEAEFVFNVVAVNDNPKTVIVDQNGRGKMIDVGSGELRFTTEQIRDVDTNGDLRIIVLASDPDENDVLTFALEAPARGNISKHAEIHAVTFSENPDCGANSKTTVNWDRLAREILREEESFTLPRPCGLDDTMFGETVTWALTVVTYTPDLDFHGKDSFKVIIISSSQSFIVQSLI
jgi:hypothetical protein